MFESIFPILGILLCAGVLLQFGMWTAMSFSTFSQNRKQFRLSMDKLRTQIAAASQSSTLSPIESFPAGDWKGYRWFVVARTVKESHNCTSVYFAPEDGKAIVGFKPGQHLTLQFDVPGEAKPIVRCYSLSDAPHESHYRISVKVCGPPAAEPELPAGRVSSFVNQQLKVGDRVRIKSPSGSFYLREESEVPIVLLGAGIGVTPFTSMFEYLHQQNSTRPVLLLYGVTNSTEHAFAERLANIAAARESAHVINVYSDPLDTDALGPNCQLHGRIDIDLIRRLVPNQNCEFYMCGPPGFMNAIYSGLTEWGIPDERIHFEAFGPASVKRRIGAADEPSTVESSVPVCFESSNQKLVWSGKEENLLDFADAHGVVIESGCRAGSCGTCETPILEGSVSYVDGHKPDCKPRHCLVCIARPNGPVVLDA